MFDSVLSMDIGEQADFYIAKKKLKRVDRSKYLETYVTSNCTLDIEILTCIKLHLVRVPDCEALSTLTKLKVYNQCIIPFFNNTAMPTSINSENKQDGFITNDEIFKRAKTEHIATILTRKRLRWFGQVTGMSSGRPVKALLFGEITDGSRKVGRPQLRYKDTLKDLLKKGGALLLREM